MQFIKRRAIRIFFPFCVLVSMIVACEKSATPPEVTGTESSAQVQAAPVKEDVTPQEAKAILDAKDGVVYLDVRTVAEFTAGHVPGSLNIPFLVDSASGGRAPNAEFLKIAQAVLPKDAKIIVACRSGSRSKRAQGVMKTAGYSHLANMLGGFNGKPLQEGWTSLDYPVESGDGGANSYAALRAKATP